MEKQKTREEELKPEQPGIFERQQAYQYVKNTPIDEDLVCVICHDPLLDPVVDPSCGQMFCRRCLEIWYLNNTTCPHCRAPSDIQKVVIPPRMVTNAVDRLLVFCPVCSGQFERKALATHIPKCPQPCKLGCGEVVAPMDEVTHDTLCTAKVVSCLAADVGCDYQCVRHLLSQHTTTCNILPLRIILLKQQDMEKELKESKARIQQLEATVLILQQTHNKASQADRLNHIQDGLANALENNSISSLTLQKSPSIQHSEFEALAEALHTNTSLKYLELRDFEFLHQGSQVLGDALQINTGVTSLTIRSLLGDSGTQPLAKALHTNFTLVQLNLNDNLIGDIGATSLAAALCTNSTLRRLYLRLNQIGDQGAQALAGALCINTTLLILDLQGNQIGDGGAQALIEPLCKANSSLRVLNVGNNKIGNAGKRALRSVQGECVIDLRAF